MGSSVYKGPTDFHQGSVFSCYVCPPLCFMRYVILCPKHTEVDLNPITFALTLAPDSSPLKWLTHCISRVVKIRGKRNIFTGTVRMRTKGKASDAEVDMTAHNEIRHTNWIPVNRCMRKVFTWSTHKYGTGYGQCSSFYKPVILVHSLYIDSNCCSPH